MATLFGLVILNLNLSNKHKTSSLSESVLLWTFSLPFNIGAMIFLPVGIAFALAYSHYFIETKTGFCKRFIWLFLISLILLELISYLWLIKGVIF